MNDITMPVFYMMLTYSENEDTAPVIVTSLGDSGMLSILRTDELNTLSSDQLINGYGVTMYFHSKSFISMGAWLSIIRTIFVCFVLAISILKLSKDTESLVLDPLEAMIKKVDKISKNPLEAAAIEERECQEMEDIKQKSRKQWEMLKERSSYEPAILERTVIKIGTLLAIGFGEAGSAIIAQNMAQGSGNVNPMMEGKKIVAIFGFCDIRFFEDITDILKTDILPFVNKVADIVHSTVNYFQGAPNKNIGEAFLMVWKIPDGEGGEVTRGDNNQLIATHGPQTKILADLSIISFIKVIASINKSQRLHELCNQEALLRQLKVKEFKVSMGFGLHIGWGIEGAIGSKFKIDASYLSPNVNMAARLQAATKQFGVHLLISGTLENYVSDQIKKHLRLIDRVTVKGSIQPMGRLLII
jgi:class 3 adenylate cyclase